MTQKKTKSFPAALGYLLVGLLAPLLLYLGLQIQLTWLTVLAAALLTGNMLALILRR